MRWIPGQVGAHQRRVKGNVPLPAASQLRHFQKPSKYRNEITVVDGIKFHSKAEARRWRELKLLEQAGQISHLRRQVRFARIRPDGEIIEIYICDFDYRDSGLTGMRNGNKRHVEDVKSEATAATPAYVRKKRWMHSEYGIVIEEIR
jgi:hypothetical protein